MPYGEIRASTQHPLIDFLRAEANIGAMFVQSALLSHNDGHMKHYAQAKANSLKAHRDSRKVHAPSDGHASTGRNTGSACRAALLDAVTAPVLISLQLGLRLYNPGRRLGTSRSFNLNRWSSGGPSILLKMVFLPSH